MKLVNATEFSRCHRNSWWVHLDDRFVLGNMKAMVAVVLIFCAGHAHGVDSCKVQIRSSLAVALGKGFPKFRAPLAADNLAKDIELDLKEGRKGCLGVATADFDGDGVKDYLLGLTALKGSGALVVVALARGKNWTPAVPEALEFL